MVATYYELLLECLRSDKFRLKPLVEPFPGVLGGKRRTGESCMCFC